MSQKLLFVNTTVKDTNVLEAACLPNVSFVLYDEQVDTYASLQQKVADLNVAAISEVGFIFETNANAPSFKLLGSQAVESKLNNVEMDEPALDSWSEMRDFMNALKSGYAVQVIDFFACDFYRNPDWKYVLNTLEVQVGLHIRASTDATGNMANGGNWIMESDNTNIQSIYFNENIADYQFVFGTDWQSTLIIATDGKIYGCGRNDMGQLGIGNTTSPKTSLVEMTSMPAGKTPKSVISGQFHTIVLMTDGTIFGCGYNPMGQLGNGNNTDQTTLTQMTNMPAGKTPKSVSCGDNFTIVFMTDGTIFGCGNNNYGQLGSGSSTKNILAQIPNDTGKTPNSVSCGYSNVFVFMTDNTIYGMGYNLEGQLGKGNNTNISTLTIMTNTTGKTPKSISANAQTIVLMTDNTIYGCGYNFSGELGNGNTTNRNTLAIGGLMTNMPAGKTPRSVSTGGGITMVFMTDNTIYGCGNNANGSLGIDNTISPQTALVQMTMPSGKTPKSVMTSYRTNIVLMTDGTIYGTGWNSFAGQLGTGDLINKNTLTAMTTNGTIYGSLLAGQMPNNLVTGSVTISGTATVGQTLTASNTLADEDGLGAISYQWKSNGTAISGATSSTYVLLVAQVGTTITVTASYTDNNNNAESVTSSATSSVQPILPPNAPTALVATAGNAAVSVAFTAGANGGSAITNYQYSTNNGTNWIAFSPAVTASPILITKLSTDGTTNLTNGTAYTILLRAVNVAGAGTASSSVSATPTLNTTLITQAMVDVAGNWPMTINGGTLANPKTIVFASNLTINSVTKYFIVGSEYVTIDGNGYSVAINSTSNYLGLVRNGTGSATMTAPVTAGYSNVTVKNITMNSSSSTLATGAAAGATIAGWLCQQYFGNGLNSTTTCTNNYIINCVNNAAITLDQTGGFVGQYCGSFGGNVIISNCINNAHLVVTNNNRLGGFTAWGAGNGGNMLIINSINNGNILTTKGGGFYGSAAGARYGSVSNGNCIIQNCYNTGSVATGSGAFFGMWSGYGVGSGSQPCQAINCYNVGTVASLGGGIFGDATGYGGSATAQYIITNCYVTNAAAYQATSSGNPTGTITVTNSTCAGAGVGWSDTTANSRLTGKTDKSVWLDYSSSTSVPYVLASNWVRGMVTYAYSTPTLAYNALLAIGYASGDLVNDTNASAIFAALAPAVPNAPTSLVATIGNQQVSIAFTAGASNNAAITNYQYSTNSGSTWTVLSPAVAVSPVVITGLTNGSAYSIMLQAINSVGAGASSSAVSFTPGVAPDAPYGLVATAGNQQVSIAFTAGAANGIAITNYQYSIDNGTNWTTRSPVATTSPLVITGLTNGTAYNIKIRAINAMFNGTASTTIVSTPSTTAGAPTSLVATPGNQQATIAFTAGASNGAIVTNYEYSFDGTAWTAFSPYLGVSPAIITGLTNGNTYNIQLRAVNAAGSGAASSAVSVMPAIAPDAPSALVATASNQQVSIAFTAGASNGIAVTNYQYSTDNGVSWRARSPVATTSPIVLTKLSIDGSTNLVNGTTYYIKLRAINASFNGAETSAIASMPLSTPAAPTGLAATVDNQQTIVSFTAGINNGAAVNNYKYSIDNGSSYAAFSPAVTSSPVTITGLTNGTTYNIKLMAVNSVGDGVESAAVAVIPATVPSAPTGVSVAHGNQQVVVSFTAGATNGAAITNYLYSKNSGITWTAFSPAVTASPITITGLTNGTSYGIQIKARNSVGDGIAADAGAVIPSTIAGAPTNPVTTLGNQQVTVAFTAGANNGAPITNYKYSIDNGSNYTAFSPAVTTSPVTIVGLSNGTAYNIKIRAVNLNGDGAQSVDSAIITTDVPAAPTGLSAVPSGQTATISFTPGSNRGAAITNYKYSLDGGAWIAFPTPIAASPVAVVGLANGTTYNIKLKAVNAVGDGDESAAVSVTPCLPPSAPAALVATAGAKQVSVAFTPGANNGSAITNYKYSIDGGATYAAFSTPITTSPVLITGLADGTTYSIKLKGINAAGDGYESTAVSAKTYGVPAIPTNVVAVAAYQRADITFTAGVNNGSVITNYQYLLNNTGSWINLSPVDITSPITIPDLTNSTTYGIKIRAINAIGGGVESAEVSITTPSSPTVPSAPTSLLVLAGNQQMTVSFNAGPNNGSAITTYQYSTDNGTTWANRSNSPATTSPIIITTASSNGTTLVNGVPYKIKLRAVNGIGNGAASAAVLAISVSPPAAPSNLYPEPGNGEAIIYFTAGNSNGAIITYYQYSLDNGTTWLSANITSTVNSVTITNLDNGATYNIMLRAISSVGNGDASVASEDIIPMGEVLGAVLDGYIMNGTITIKDLSDNLIAGPIMTDLYGNYSIPVNLTSSVTYIVTCSGGIDIATNLPSVYPLTTIIHDSNASSISQLNTNINPLTTIMANIAKTAIVSGTNATSAIAAVKSTVATALGMDASNVGLDYIASRSVAVGVAAVKIATLTNMIQIATGANADVVSQAVAAAISGSSGLLTVDSTFINSVLSNASASLSATEVTNLTGMASNVTLSMDALANPGSFMSVNESLTSLFTIAVAAQAVVTPTNLQNASLNASSTVSSAVAAVPAEQIGTISTAGLVTANICFARGTKIKTDQGIVEIQKLSEQNTIDGEQIVMITKTKNMDDYMVVIKKDAFGKNVPNEDTYLTGEHQVLFEGEMVKSKDLLNGNTIVKEQMKSHMVYNVLMKHEGRVIANNMVAESLDPKNPFVELLMSLEHNKVSTAETLDPKSPFAKLLSSINLKKRTIADKEEIVVEMNRTMRTAHKNRKM